MTNSIGNDAYATYEGFSDFSYNSIVYLMNHDELIWKLLKYDAPDAYLQPDLTRAEKAAMIYAGEEDETLYKVFSDTNQPDAWVHRCTTIRISPFDIYPNNRSIGTLGMLFEVYSHYKINHLSNYKTRVDWIAERFLKVFNGAVIGGIGCLYFDKLGSQGSRLFPSGQTPFKGKSLLFGNRMG